MFQTTTRPRQRLTSFDPWSTFFASTPKLRPDTLQVLPTAPHTPGSDEEAVPSTSTPHNGVSKLNVVTSDAQPGGPPSYVYALSQCKPTSYRFVQNSAFSMSLVTQDEPSNVAYNISVGANVWMPSEHITLVRRHANLDGPVLARLE